MRPQSDDVQNVIEYFSRKGYLAVNVEGLCDLKLRFTFISCRCAGSTHDSTAWTITELSQTIKDRKLDEY